MSLDGLHRLRPMGYAPPPPPPRRRYPRETLTFDAWILADTDLLFMEWVEANALPPKPPAPPAPPRPPSQCVELRSGTPYAVPVETGVLRASFPRSPNRTLER